MDLLHGIFQPKCVQEEGLFPPRTRRVRRVDPWWEYNLHLLVGSSAVGKLLGATRERSKSQKSEKRMTEEQDSLSSGCPMTTENTEHCFAKNTWCHFASCVRGVAHEKRSQRYTRAKEDILAESACDTRMSKNARQSLKITQGTLLISTSPLDRALQPQRLKRHRKRRTSFVSGAGTGFTWLLQ